MLEVVVAIVLLAITLPLLFSLFPASLRTMNRSQVVQQAMLLATYRMDEAPAACRGPGLQLTESRPLDARTFLVQREYYAVDIYRMDVTVRVQTEGQAPIVLTSRLLYSSAP